jgi:site-specific DNA-cytosine methylase
MQKLVADLLEIGYQCRVFGVVASAYGDPQKRPRIILFAARFDAYLPDAPAPKPGDERTLHQALADLIDIKPTSGSGRVLTTSGKIVEQHCSESLELKAENEHLSQCVDGLARSSYSPPPNERKASCS